MASSLKHYRRNLQSGMTLVEVAVVAVLIGVLSTIISTKFDFVSVFRTKGEIRNFLNTWQLLLNEAANDGNTYRFIVDLDQNSYFVRQEIPLPQNGVEQVDLLKNLRLKSEKERRKRIQNDQVMSQEDIFKLTDEQEQNKTLEELFGISVFADPGNNVSLAVPASYPSLAEEQQLSYNVRIKDMIVDGELIDHGEVTLYFSPQGASNIAIVHFQVDNQLFSAVLNPFSGESTVQAGETDFQFVERGKQNER